jgi:hypothetical protein
MQALSFGPVGARTTATVVRDEAECSPAQEMHREELIMV